jgi:hypothetical protein
MFIFLLSIVVVVIISFCFFGKRFWENRYLILLIIGGVSLVLTIITNYAVRGKFETKSEVLYKKPIHNFYVQDSLFKGNSKTRIIENWKFVKYNDKYFTNKKDKKHKQTPVTFIIYTHENKMYVAVYKKGNKGLYYFDEIYFAPSPADTIAYVCKKTLVYDIPPTNWITGFSMPRVSAIKILYVPPKEYKLIPDSLIRKLPF